MERLIFKAWQRAYTLPERYAMTRYFKILVDGKSCHGGNSTWSLPEGDKPGDWMPKLTKIVPCERGYHIVKAQQIPQWLKNNCQIFEVEVSGKVIPHGDDKHVCGKVRLVKQMKWDSEVPRQFAADCAEHVLHIYENDYPEDDRPRKAIEATRKYARKEIDAAAWDAAWDAAWAAAWAARAAARAAGAAGDARDPWDAAWDAAWAAQIDQLLTYF